MYRTEWVVDGEPEDALLRGARAARRMGARLARYDAETLALEAHLTRWRIALVLRLHVAGAGQGRTRLAIESGRAGDAARPDLGLARLTVARFRSILAGTDLPDLRRR